MIDLKRMNWFGLAGGILLLVIVLFSLLYAYPWWQILVGDGAGEAKISPVSYDATIMGNKITTPLIWYLNVTSVLSLVASAIAIIIYSIMPNKSYSKHLLGFAYKKPLIMLVIFVVLLFAATSIANAFIGIAIPVAGASTITLGAGSMMMEAPITTGFTWVFWLAVVAAVLCVAARFYHKRIAQAPPAAAA